jgi:hypothetical protein
MARGVNEKGSNQQKNVFLKNSKGLYFLYGVVLLEKPHVLLDIFILIKDRVVVGGN